MIIRIDRFRKTRNNKSGIVVKRVVLMHKTGSGAQLFTLHEIVQRINVESVKLLEASDSP